MSPLAATVVGLVLAAMAAACVAWPLRRSAGRLFVALVLIVPLLALTLYRITGTPAALQPGATLPRGIEGGAAPASAAEAIAALQAELTRNPAQAEGWALLARAQVAQGDADAASESFTRALALTPDDPVLLVEAALARAQADETRRFDDPALAMLRRALAIDSRSQRARWFLGVALRQRGDDAGAAAAWERLLPEVDAATAGSLRQQIDIARIAAGQPALPAVATAPPVPPGTVVMAPPAAGIRLRVTLDPAFVAGPGMDDDATVFVLARIPGGPPMPVAAERLRLGDLPASLVLDDGDSPMPTRRLSELRAVEVLARLSASGTATRQAGDVESDAVQVTLPATGAVVELVIGTRDGGARQR
ncbi:MAG TPA: tetratricopeptide repeat protein [Luteimonas sp.]|nr:tetratricopeptide repeat protein [Luteimonas sp.]